MLNLVVVWPYLERDRDRDREKRVVEILER